MRDRTFRKRKARQSEPLRFAYSMYSSISFLLLLLFSYPKRFPTLFCFVSPISFQKNSRGNIFTREREREPFSCILYSEGNDFLFVSFGDFDSFLLLRVHLLPFWIFSTLRLSTTTIEGKDTKLNKKKVARLL